MKLISKFALLILLAGILYLLISGNLLSKSPLVIILQITAVLLSIWARRSFNSGQFNINVEPLGGPLLLTGPYRYIRHPMYAAALLLIWPSIIGHLHIISVVSGLLITCVIAIRIVDEDKTLREHFTDYERYSDTTKRIIPFLI